MFVGFGLELKLNYENKNGELFVFDIFGVEGYKKHKKELEKINTLIEKNKFLSRSESVIFTNTDPKVLYNKFHKFLK